MKRKLRCSQKNIFVDFKVITEHSLNLLFQNILLNSVFQLCQNKPQTRNVLHNKHCQA